MAQLKLPEKILMVDDEANILDSFRRELRGRVNLETALGGQEALQCQAEHGPYAVVITDFKMPGMNGVELLAHFRQKSPNTVRMMLTGYADANTTIKAVNEGNIFRLLTKPCDTATLLTAMVAGIEQYRLIRAEKDLLEKTLRGCIKVLSDLLAMVKPEALNRATRVLPYVNEIIKGLEMPPSWKYEAAVLLSQIGCVTLPDQIMWKVAEGKGLSAQEKLVFSRHPGIASELISGIPRMEEIAQIVSYQQLSFSGVGSPASAPKEEAIPLGARILKVVLDFDDLVVSGLSKGKALEKMKKDQLVYDPAVITVMDQVLGIEAKYDIKQVSLYELEEKMVLAEDVIPRKGGKKLVSRGQALSKAMIMTIKNYNRVIEVRTPIKVIVPLGRG